MSAAALRILGNSAAGWETVSAQVHHGAWKGFEDGSLGIAPAMLADSWHSPSRALGVGWYLKPSTQQYLMLLHSDGDEGEPPLSASFTRAGSDWVECPLPPEFGSKVEQLKAARL